jgi:hypothetical protein
MKIRAILIFWVITSCNLLTSHQDFEGALDLSFRVNETGFNSFPIAVHVLLYERMKTGKYNFKG